jgi:hypothetical protein
MVGFVRVVHECLYVNEPMMFVGGRQSQSRLSVQGKFKMQNRYHQAPRRFLLSGLAASAKQSLK